MIRKKISYCCKFSWNICCWTQLSFDLLLNHLRVRLWLLYRFVWWCAKSTSSSTVLKKKNRPTSTMEKLRTLLVFWILDDNKSCMIIYIKIQQLSYIFFNISLLFVKYLSSYKNPHLFLNRRFLNSILEKEIEMKCNTFDFQPEN